MFEKLARKYKVSNPLHAPKVTHPNNDEDKQKKSFFDEQLIYTESYLKIRFVNKNEACLFENTYT